MYWNVLDGHSPLQNFWQEVKHCGLLEQSQVSLHAKSCEEETDFVSMKDAIAAICCLEWCANKLTNMT